MSKILHLNLIRIWFDLIWNREKSEEYREIKPYWCSRFLMVNGKHKTYKWWKIYFDFHSKGDVINLIENSIIQEVFSFKKNDSTTFSNGMTPPVPRFEIELKGIRIGEGKPEWGAEPGKKYFILSLGKILNHANNN